MARISPETYKPLLQFRFRIIFSAIGDIGIYGKSATLPIVENNPITVEYGNTYMKVKGKTRWNDISFTCYAFEGLTFEQLWSYLSDLHQSVSLGTDFYADRYKKDIQIQLLSPDDQTIVGTWKLIGGFISTLNYGQLDWSSDEVVQPQVTISYDYAEFVSNNQQQYQFT